MYLGESPSTPDPKKLKAMNRRAARIAEKLDVELRIYMEAYKTHKTHSAAYMSLFPDYTGKSAGNLGWRIMQKVEKVISRKEIHAMLGLSEEAVVSAVGRGLIARAKKDFILPRSGQILSTPDYDDIPSQLAAAGIGGKMLGLFPKDEKGEQQIVVNVVSYVPLTGPGSLRDDPWPGGGREGPVYTGTVVRNALPPSTTTNITGLDPGVREDGKESGTGTMAATRRGMVGLQDD